MPIQETVSKQNVLRVYNGAISTDTTTNGAIIDTADLDMGVSFYIGASAYTDGTYKLVIQESDDSGMSGATTVAGDQLVEVDDLKAVTDGVTAATASGGKLAKVGVISTARYLRAQIVSTATSSGATIEVLAVVSPEFCPAL